MFARISPTVSYEIPSPWRTRTCFGSILCPVLVVDVPNFSPSSSRHLTTTSFGSPESGRTTSRPCGGPVFANRSSTFPLSSSPHSFEHAL